MVEQQVHGTERRADSLVDDVVFRGPDGMDVEAYLVRPLDLAEQSPGPGLVMWHWLDSEAPDGNRAQYLDEAAELAEAGVVSVLPQGRFPWTVDPRSSAADAAEIRAEVARLHACLDLLEARPDVDEARLGIVGHDFGGMLAILAAAETQRLRALVVVAATPRWGDWFLPFWPIAEDRIDYLGALRSLDPVERIGQAGTGPLLLQFAERDYFIALMAARELQRAGPEGTELRLYDTGHDMRLPSIRADRRAFLSKALGLEVAGGRPSKSPGDQAATT